MSLEEYITSLKAYKGFAGDIVCHKTLAPGSASFSSEAFPLNPDLKKILGDTGITSLYAHQLAAIKKIKRREHTVIATPTASGKSLVYNLPVIDTLMNNENARALYLFPLKALARDQLDTVQHLLRQAGMALPSDVQFRAAVYDGDISSYQKTKIRQAPPHVLLTNPEMLHLAMLAHHRLWEDFFKNLTHVVVDEVHTYRGVMGSNMAWVFRRLLRICRFYGADPVFIFCSATIANPAALAQDLTGLSVCVVDESGAPTGQKDVLLMRGMEGASQTAIALIHAALHRKLRTIVYTQSRKVTELIALWVSQRAKAFKDKISAYRAGFLPEERRNIEKKLSTGELLTVVSTSALELGIDIGNLDLCILVGYPGTMMSTWQRAGRVGRDGKKSALILIAHEDALDQYMVNHPDIFFAMAPEQAVINPYNEEILKKHLVCAAAEMTLENGEPFLEHGPVQQAVSSLEMSVDLLKSRSGRLWYAARKSPHRDVSLRGTGNTLPIFIEDTKQSLGDIDRHRSFFETHQGAVYLHRGDSYVITRFDHVKGVVQARRKDLPYYTRARSNKSTEIMEQLDMRPAGGTRVGYGRLKITEQVTGYDKKLVATQKSLGIEPLDLPKLEFETQGLWIEIPDAVREQLETAHMHFMGGIHALEHAAIGIMPLLVMTDRNDLGGISTPFHPQVDGAAVFIYDGVPGGLGLSRQAFEQALVLLERTFQAISSCSCDTGCPACVHSPKCGSGNRPIDKAAALAILQQILGRPESCLEELSVSPVTNQPGLPPVPSSPLAPLSTSSGPSPARVEEETQLFDAPDDLNGRNTFNGRYGVLDIETRRSAKDVGGWNRADRMGVSVAVLYDSGDDRFKEYFQEDIERLCEDLKQLDLVIGFNIIRFDYKVLSGLSPFDFHSLPTLDILLKVHERLGYRLSLDRLAAETLGEKKSADGLQALEWFKQGQMDKIAEYCRQDVKVTRDLYLFGLAHGYLVFRNKAGNTVRLPLEMSP